MSDITIFVNTHSSAADLWPMFFSQLRKHWTTRPRLVVATNKATDTPFPLPGMLWNMGDSIVNYSPAKRFTSQYLMGLCAVETPYVLTMQEDMILYGDVHQLIGNLVVHPDYDCLRLIRSGEGLRYSMQATIWRTQVLKGLYASFDASTPWDAEVVGHEVAKNLDIKTAIMNECGQKRGRDHWDNPHFPYIATALVKGAWNAEYRVELEPLHAEYHIDASKRGWTE